MSPDDKLVIIGGGICGLSVGWYVASKGVNVTLLEKGQVGQGATWASAGMLAAQLEAEPGEARLLPLLLESQKMWPDFASQVEKASGLDVGYRTEGTIMVATNANEAAKLRNLHDFLRKMKLQVKMIRGSEACRIEPHLSRNCVQAILSPGDHQVDNRKVALALKEAFIRAGGKILENTEVKAIRIQSNQVTEVEMSDNKTMRAEKILLAAGAWSGGIAGLPESVRPPVTPVKGQMLAVRMDPSHPILSHVVWGRDAYLVPRKDGRLLIGATVEDAGFDTRLTAGGIFQLLRGAWETLPGIYDLEIAEIWAGLRPRSRDDAPILGPTEVQGLVMATGHYRNGILLAPITAKTVSQYILTDELPVSIRPFTLNRFH